MTDKAQLDASLQIADPTVKSGSETSHDGRWAASPQPNVKPMQTKYPSRIAPWIAVTLIGAPLVVMAVGAFTLTTSIGAGVVAMVTGLFVGGVIVALTLPCVYTLTDDGLKIKSGLLEDDVPLADILGAEMSGSLWSAPALSLRRVKIRLKNGARVISPQDRERFIADLEARLHPAKAG